MKLNHTIEPLKSHIVVSKLAGMCSLKYTINMCPIKSITLTVRYANKFATHIIITSTR